jgi:FkbM family methyltransferase
LFTTLDLTDELQRVVYWQGVRYEKATLDILTTHARESECFFDIGANFGFISYVLLSRCPALRVFAFEPNPRLFSSMNTVKLRNALDSFVPVNAGLGAEPGDLELHISTLNSGHSTFGLHPGLASGSACCESAVAPVIVFDEWCRISRVWMPEQPRWLAKIDAEGYELNVLKGMRKSLEAQRFRCVCVEINRFTLSFCGTTPVAVGRFMADVGYEADDGNGKRYSSGALPEFANVFFVPRK